MENIKYSIEQVYNDKNILVKPYPFCPRCHQLINLEINNAAYATTPKYFIKCHNCNNYIFVENSNINMLHRQWNDLCINEIKDKWCQQIHDNIFKIEFGLISLFLLFVYIFQNMHLLPLLAIVIYLPFFFSWLGDLDCITNLLQKHIISKSINNIYMNKLDKINIQDEINNLFKIKQIIKRIEYEYFPQKQINEIITMNKKIYTYYLFNTHIIDKQYVYMLNKFYNTIIIMKEIINDNLTEKNELNDLFNVFYTYFLNKLNKINSLKEKEIDNKIKALNQEISNLF